MYKIPLELAPQVFENWMETPPLPRLQHIPLEEPFTPEEDRE